MTNVLCLQALHKTYRASSRGRTVEVHALRGVDLTITAGEYVAIMGPSGSGKSTLLHIIGLLDTLDAGSYRLRETEVAGLGEDALAGLRNREIGFVFQAFFLLPRLTALRNVELPLLYRGLSRAERRVQAEEMLTAVGLADRMDHYPTELSGGQKQRVALARALVQEPSLLLADEPTGNLDSQSSAEVLDLIDGLHQAGRTVVMVTHEPDVAARAERIVRMRDGLIVDAGGQS
jgi:putative ABC transport system ATP-binding protein